VSLHIAQRSPAHALHIKPKAYTNILKVTARLKIRAGMCCVSADGVATCGQ
jgi:hypothetical protein